MVPNLQCKHLFVCSHAQYYKKKYPGFRSPLFCTEIFFSCKNIPCHRYRTVCRCASLLLFHKLKQEILKLLLFNRFSSLLLLQHFLVACQATPSSSLQLFLWLFLASLLLYSTTCQDNFAEMCSAEVMSSRARLRYVTRAQIGTWP